MEIVDEINVNYNFPLKTEVEGFKKLFDEIVILTKLTTNYNITFQKNIKSFTIIFKGEMKRIPNGVRDGFLLVFHYNQNKIISSVHLIANGKELHGAKPEKMIELLNDAKSFILGDDK